MAQICPAYRRRAVQARAVRFRTGRDLARSHFRKWVRAMARHKTRHRISKRNPGRRAGKRPVYRAGGEHTGPWPPIPLNRFTRGMAVQVLLNGRVLTGTIERLGFAIARVALVGRKSEWFKFTQLSGVPEKGQGG